MRRQVAAYVEGELESPEARRVAAHVDTCAACRREEAQYRLALGALSAPREPERPGDLFPAFAARLAAQEARRHAYRPMRWAAAAASLLLVTALAGAAWRHLATTHVVPDQQAVSPVSPDRAVRTAVKTGQPDSHPSPGGTMRAADSTNAQPSASNLWGFDHGQFDPGPDQAAPPDQSAKETRAGRGDTAPRQRSTPRTRVAKRSDAGAWMHDWVNGNHRKRPGAPASTSHEGPRVAPVNDGEGAYGGAAPLPDNPGTEMAMGGAARQPVAVEGPRGSVMRQLSDERVHVGDNWTRVRTASGFDRKGRQLVNVVIEATPSPVEGAGRPRG